MMIDDPTAASHPPVRRRRAPDRRPALGVSSYPLLTERERRRLALYKARYTLEPAGFTADQVGRLLFLTWLRARRGLHG